MDINSRVNYVNSILTRICIGTHCTRDGEISKHIFNQNFGFEHIVHGILYPFPAKS